MHRIDTATAQKDKFGAGKNGFTRGNPQTGTPATDLDGDYFDMLQEELVGVVEASGIELDKSKHNQLLTALKKLFLSRSNPFGDIKADGAEAIATALANLQLGEAAKVSLGVDQTWQDMTSSRSIGVVYTNTTGKPIQLLLDFVRPSASWSVNVRINGVAINGAGGYCPVIPNNATYQVITTGIPSVSWRELR